MKFRLSHIFILLSVSLWLLYSCSSTKFVPDGEYLLNDASVKVDAKDITYFDLEPYIKQKSNYKTFELIKFPLFIYNLSGRDSTKWINRVLRSGGEPPVIFDSTLIQQTVVDLSRVMYNKGYLDVEVEPEIRYKGKKVNVVYNINSNFPSIIDNYTITIVDSVFEEGVLEQNVRVPRRMRSSLKTDADSVNVLTFLQAGSLLKKGDQFDVDLLNSERERISSIFRRNGYMTFDKEYIGFVADTIGKGNKVDLEMVVYPFVESIGGNQTIETKHRQYYVDIVDIYVDYNPIEDGDISNYQATDTVVRDKFRVFYGERGKYIKPFVILENCYIQPGTLFNESQTTLTYNALSQLKILRNVNIRYEEYQQNDSTGLRCVITAVPDKKQGISAEVEGTNSGGYFGVGAGLGYMHRNAFGGSELFDAKVKGIYEAVSPNFSSFRDNYFEIGGEMGVTFPRFMFPFLKGDLRRRLRASTQFVSSYTYQRRPNFFTRTVFSTGVKYIWENRGVNASRHTLDLIDISYAHIPYLNPDFETTLSDNAKIYSFTDQFIVSMGYSYYKTNSMGTGLVPIPRRDKTTYSLRASIETAGNVLSLIAKLADLPQTDNGSRKIFGTYFAQYVRGNIDYSKNIRIDNRSSFAWRLGGGIAYPYGNNKLVPFQKRFFSGGANSVRGWSARELGPGAFYRADANFNDQSGDIRFDANIEYRSKAFWKLELAAFLDAGNIWTIKGTDRQYKGEFKLDRFYKEIAYAWGLGFRLDFDFVIVRLDCGWKIYNPADIPKFKTDGNGYLIPDGYKSKWAIGEPLKFRENTSWHIAVGYPF